MKILQSDFYWLSLLKDAHAVATPEPDPTQMASLNQNPGDAHLFILFFVLLNFLFQKCHDPNPWPDLNGESEPEPGLLRSFQLSCQNIFFMLFLFRFLICAEQFLNGRPINIYISQNTITVKAFYALSNDIQTKRFFRVRLFVHKISHVKKGIDMHMAGIHLYAAACFMTLRFMI